MTAEEKLQQVVSGHSVSEAREENLSIAIELGADFETLVLLRDATRLCKAPYIILPPNRLEGLSRGRGYCGWRAGGRIRGSYDKFADRVKDGYKVTEPGLWVVGGSDGFSRKQTAEWEVEHVQVGSETWTIAS